MIVEEDVDYDTDTTEELNEVCKFINKIKKLQYLT